jgi:hypothetical protein
VIWFFSSKYLNFEGFAQVGEERCRGKPRLGGQARAAAGEII